MELTDQENLTQAQKDALNKSRKKDHKTRLYIFQTLDALILEKVMYSIMTK